MRAMISVLIPARDEAEALAGLLTTLVPAAVDGLVRDVVVADEGASGAIAELCEESGATLLRGSIAAAAARGRGDWLMILSPQARLPVAWREAVGEHVMRSTEPALLLPPPVGRWLADRRRDRSAGLLIRVRDFGGAQGDMSELRRRFSPGAVRIG
jgi:hypothetical protein